MTELAKKETMTSLEIAEVTGKRHSDVLEAIRNMEPAWEKVSQRKFPLSSYKQRQPNGGYKDVPCYILNKTECLYVATKFHDEARAKLVLRWEELEIESRKSMVTIPNFSNPAEAARAWAEQYEKNLALEENNKKLEDENKTLAPKGAYFDNLVDKKLLTNFRDTAKEIGLTQNAFIDILLNGGYIYRDANKRIKPRAKYANDLFELKDWGNENKTGVQTLITPKGKETFRLLYGNGNCENKELLNFI